MKKVLYFAYGSNMHSWRINFRLNKEVINAGTYKLQDWKLVFNAESFIGNCTYCNIVESAGNFVEGVLYDITPDDFKKLDGYEQLYEKYFFDIDKDTLGCVYICTKQEHLDTYYTPDEHYMDVCIKGAVENNLAKTAAYLINLREQINFKLARRPKTFNNY